MPPRLCARCGMPEGEVVFRHLDRLGDYLVLREDGPFPVFYSPTGERVKPETVIGDGRYSKFPMRPRLFEVKGGALCAGCYGRECHDQTQSGADPEATKKKSKSKKKNKHEGQIDLF